MCELSLSFSCLIHNKSWKKFHSIRWRFYDFYKKYFILPVIKMIFDLLKEIKFAKNRPLI